MRNWTKPQSEWALQPCAIDGMSGIFMLGPIEDTKKAEDKMRLQRALHVLGIAKREDK